MNSFDAEGHAVVFDNVPVTYDALGRAVEAGPSGSVREIVYGPDGSKHAVMNAYTLVRAYIPLPGGDEAVYGPSGIEYYRHADYLGSARLASTWNQALDSSTAYAPEGENYDSSGSDLSFTGQKQDIAGGQYDFLFREYSPVQGRWWTPDPAGRPGVWPSLAGAGLFGTAALPLTPFGTGAVSAEGVALDAQPCALDASPPSTGPGPGSGFGSPAGCAGGAASQLVAAANNFDLGSAASNSAPNPLAAVDPNNPQTWNRYAYVGGNPDGVIDPDGRISPCIWIPVIGIAGGLILGPGDLAWAWALSVSLHSIGCGLLFAE